MKKYLLILLYSVIFPVLLSSCFLFNKKNNRIDKELVGDRKTKGRIWREPGSHGMIKIPRGSFTMGLNEEDVFNSLNLSKKAITVEAFWMDETEITNNEYRQFTEWVKEQKARQILAEQYEDFLTLDDDQGNPLEEPTINWDVKIDWDDPEIIDALNDLYLPPDERIMGKKEIDTRKLVYEWTWVDLFQAAQAKYNYETNEYEGYVVDPQGNVSRIVDRSSFLMRDATHIYPDTLVWIRDFSYSYNEPLANLYFTHPGFDEYPVVGITWKQAVAFSHWRTSIYNDFGLGRNDYTIQNYRLPTEAEWEWASRGGRLNNKYPWGGPYIRNKQGCFMANFKPLRGNYVSDGYVYTAPVGQFSEGKNDYGLYDMSGNVSEWTSSAYDESSYDFVHDMNPNYQYNAKNNDPRVMKRKVVRGGSWKDVKHYLQSGARDYEYQDEARSYIGFRCVRSYIGE